MLSVNALVLSASSYLTTGDKMMYFGLLGVNDGQLDVVDQVCVPVDVSGLVLA